MVCLLEVVGVGCGLSLAVKPFVAVSLVSLLVGCVLGKYVVGASIVALVIYPVEGDALMVG